MLYLHYYSQYLSLYFVEMFVLNLKFFATSANLFIISVLSYMALLQQSFKYLLTRLTNCHIIAIITVYA